MHMSDFLPIEAVVEAINLKLLNPVHTARSAGEFGVDVELSNSGPHILAWTPQNPVTLSYRWFDINTGVQFPLEGGRAHFAEFLRPDSSQKLHLTIKTPIFHGMATLRIACVCEGRFWFYENFPTGWTDLAVDISDPAVWPADERGSSASRALRGGVVANALQQRLRASPIRCFAPPPTQEPAPDTVLPTKEELPSFQPAPPAELAICDLDAAAPTLQSDHSVADTPAIADWRAWLRRPFATFERYVNRALTRSSLGRRVAATQAATSDLLERMQQSMDNDRHMQAMLRDMLRHQEQRDAYYAEASYNQVNLVRQDLDKWQGEINALVRQEIWDAQKAIVQQLHDQGRAHLAESRETSTKMLRSILDSVRRINLDLLKIEEGMNDRQAHQHALHLKASEAGVDAILKALGTLREELDALVRQQARDVQQAIVQDLRDQEKSHVLQSRENSEAILRAIGDLLRRTNVDLLDATLASIANISHDVQRKLAELGDVMGMMHHAQTDLASNIKKTVKDIQSENRMQSENLLRDMSVLTDRKPLEERLGAITDILQNIKNFGGQDAADIDRISHELVNISNIVETDFGYAFAKIDALLHRQSFSTPKSNKIICRNLLGLFAIPEDDLETISYYASGHLPEPGSLALVRKLLKSGDTFIDIGANVGLFSVAAGRKVGPTGSVLAFEPAPETMAALTDTIRLNGLKAIVTLHQCAAGRENGTALFHVGRICGHSSLLPLDEKRETIDISIVAVDDIVGGRKVDLIKIDVEGWELEVLEGLRVTLANNPHASVLMEFGTSHIKRAGSKPLEWIEKIRTFDLNIYEIDEDTAALAPLRSEGLDNIVSINLLLSRTSEHILNQE